MNFRGRGEEGIVGETLRETTVTDLKGKIAALYVHFQLLVSKIFRRWGWGW